MASPSPPLTFPAACGCQKLDEEEEEEEEGYQPLISIKGFGSMALRLITWTGFLDFKIRGE